MEALRWAVPCSRNTKEAHMAGVGASRGGIADMRVVGPGHGWGALSAIISPCQPFCPHWELGVGAGGGYSDIV